MEGTNLALSAVAEVLAKMDERLTKEEEEDRIIKELKDNISKINNSNE